jgi:hypothetical protein
MRITPDRGAAGSPAALAVAAVTLGMAVACASPPAQDHPWGWPAADPAEAFRAAEARLMATESARAAFRITSEGAITVALDGELVLVDAEQLLLTASGTFGDRPVRLELRVADGEMTGGNGQQTFREPAPAHVREAVLVGLTRMGLLHNLARLVAALPPDRAAGGVAEWVRAEDVRWVPPTDGSDDAGLAFRIVVSDQEAGEAELWLDPAGLPLRRLQIVRFPQGEMQVREELRWAAGRTH